MTAAGPGERTTDADAVARRIIERTGGTVRLALPLGLGKANSVVDALTRACLADPGLDLTIVTALTLERPSADSDLARRFLEPAADRLFGRYPTPLYAGMLRAGTLPPNVTVHEFFLLAGRWLAVERMQRDYIAANYTHALEYVLQAQPNVVAQLLARQEGRFSLSCNTDITVDLLEARRGGEADFLFVGEVNDNLPFMGGPGECPAGEIDCLLDHDDGGFELFSAVKRPVSLAEQAIGLHASRLVRDGGTLQIGIGSIGDGVAQALLLRHRRNAEYRAVTAASPWAGADPFAEQAPFEEGLYAVTEMLVDGLLQLFSAGVIRREVEGVAIHAGFFVDCRDFYARLRALPDDQRARIAMMPVSFTNALYGQERQKRQARIDARFINTAMMATPLGAVISDTLADGRVVSGVGGQFNFVDQAFALQGARSVITLKASRERAGKPVSTIVWSHPQQTIPRHLRDIVVTEYGIADLRGRSDADCVKAMLAITDSRFQPELLDAARRAGKIEPDYVIPPQRRHNTPERLRDWLAGPRRAGLLPVFPFGTDFTETEQRLLPALDLLSRRARSPLSIAAMMWRGWRAGAPSETDRACLARMGLARPASLRQHASAAVLRAGLRASESFDQGEDDA